MSSWLSEDRSKQLAATGAVAAVAGGGFAASKLWNQAVDEKEVHDVDSDVYINPIFEGTMDKQFMYDIMDKPYDGPLGFLHKGLDFIIDFILLAVVAASATQAAILGPASLATDGLVLATVIEESYGPGLVIGPYMSPGSKIAIDGAVTANAVAVASPIEGGMLNADLQRHMMDQGAFILNMAKNYGMEPKQVVREFYNDAHIKQTELDSGLIEVTWFPREGSEMSPVIMARFPADILEPEVKQSLATNIKSFNEESWWAQDWDFESAAWFEPLALLSWLPGVRDHGVRAMEKVGEIESDFAPLRASNVENASWLDIR